MMSTRRNRKAFKGLIFLLTSLFFFFCITNDVFAQTEERTKKEAFPIKPVTIIVAWAAGGAADITARTLAKLLTEIWKQPVIVVNHPGASGVIGSLKLASSDPDGYTLGMLSMASQVTQYTSPNPTNRNAYTYIIGAHYDVITMTVKADSPWKSLKEFVEYTKANPGKVTHSSSGASSTDKMVFMSLARKAGIQLPDVPFDGFITALTAVLSGKIASTSVTLSNVIPYLKSGDMRVLAISSEKRLAKYPDIPTFMENGIDLSLNLWFGLLGPKGISPDRVAVIQNAVEKAYGMKEWKGFLTSNNVNPFPLKGNQFKSYIDQVDPSLKEMIEEAGMMRAK